MEMTEFAPPQNPLFTKDLHSMRQPFNPNDLAALGGLICVIIGAVVAVLLIVVILYLLTLQKALSRVSPRNRLMEPGMVWLMLVPCFNIIWQFIVAIRVPDSLRNEFRDRGREDGSDYGKSLALGQAILNILNPVISNAASAAGPEAARGITFVSWGLSVVGLILFIMFWVKIAGYSSQLGTTEDGRRDDFVRRFDDYDDDDRPRSGGGSPEPPPDTFKPGDPGRYQ